MNTIRYVYLCGKSKYVRKREDGEGEREGEGRERERREGRREGGRRGWKNRKKRKNEKYMIKRIQRMFIK